VGDRICGGQLAVVQINQQRNRQGWELVWVCVGIVYGVFFALAATKQRGDQQGCHQFTFHLEFLGTEQVAHA
jgi:hypothetical protein